MPNIPIGKEVVPDAGVESPPSAIDTVKSIKDLLLLPEVAAAIAAAQAKHIRRPPAVNRSSVYSYFREEFGLEMRVVLDRMQETGKNMEWKYADYPEYKPKTLHERISQSLRYLLTYLDPDGKYNRMRQLIVIDTKSSPQGIMLCWLRDKLQGKPFTPVEVDPSVALDNYKMHITTFLEDSDRKILQLKDLYLTDEEVELIKNSMIGTEKFCVSVITNKEIKIVKI